MNDYGAMLFASQWLGLRDAHPLEYEIMNDSF